MLKVYILLTILSILSWQNTHVSAKNPGVRIRLSQSGLNYAGSVALDVMSAKIKGQSIPDQSGRAHTPIGKVDYSVSSMRIESFSRPTSKIVLQPPQSLSWSLGGASIKLHGDWKYKYKKAFIKISDHGSFDLSAEGISISISVAIGAGSTGRPTVATRSCNANVNKVKVKFHGGASWLYNLFSKYVEKTLRSKLTDILCKEAKQAIDVSGKKQLETLKVQVPIDKILLLDYRLSGAPVFASSYLETNHKGEILWKADPKESPIAPSAMPNFDNSTKMVRFWFTDYVMNTLGGVLQEHNKMAYNLTKKDLPAKTQGYLNTTCSGICFGTLIPKLAKLFPNASVEFRLHTTQPPKLSIVPGSIKGHFAGIIGFWAHGEKCNSDIFTLSMNASVELKVGITGGKIIASVPSLKADNFKVTSTKIGNVSVSTFKSIFNYVLFPFVQEKLNELGKKGIEIPTVKDVTFVQPEIVLLKNAVFLTTNVKYTP